MHSLQEKIDHSIALVRKTEKPGQYRALLHCLQKFLDRADGRGITRHFSTAEEYFQWWVEKENIKIYKEKKKQIEIKFDNDEEDNV